MPVYQKIYKYNVVSIFVLRLNQWYRSLVTKAIVPSRVASEQHLLKTSSRLKSLDSSLSICRVVSFDVDIIAVCMFTATQS